jgi:uncharacterized protein (DUF1697 family)
MARFAAFLRAVNVGGTVKLPMATLRAMCEAEGFTAVETYIASGNVVFATKFSRDQAKAKLEKQLAKHFGKSAGVFLHDADQLKAMIGNNPFPQAEGNRLMIILLAADPIRRMIEEAKNRHDEEIALGDACLYVHYPSGMGQSKLKIPGADQGTARNMNTIRRMLEILHV